MEAPMEEAQGEEAHGTIGSLIKCRVEVRTISFAPPQTTTTTTTEPCGGGEAAAGFTVVRLMCYVTMRIRTAGGGTKLIQRSWYRHGGGAATKSCFIVLGSGEDDDVRDALRGALRSIRPLQDLGLTDNEWESIVPEDVVAKLADPEVLRARHGAAEVSLGVVLHIRYDAAGMLLTGCKKIDSNGVAAEEDDVVCSVCFDALQHREAVELPGCAHAFHRRCISKWFRRKLTCPLCRGHMVKHLDWELQNHIAVPYLLGLLDF